MSYNYKEYDEWRNSLKCDICNDTHYRTGLCRNCYKKNRKKQFHCTHRNCLNPVFGATLCQRHYRSYHQRCLVCHSKNVYYKHLCRSHYRHCTKTGNFPVEPTCTHKTIISEDNIIKCSKKTFVGGLCLHHFKKKYGQKECTVESCDKQAFRTRLCCSHYFMERRKKEKEYINNRSSI